MNKLIAVTTIAGALAVPAVASAAQFEGTIVSVNPGKNTFRINDSERGTKQIKVNRNTRFERISGISGLSAGQTNIEVVATRANGKWIASEVEKSGGGGEHGGDDD
jgi:hypothetical protein